MARLTSYDKGNNFILVNEEERLLSSKGFITKDEMYKIMRHLAERLYEYETKPNMRKKVKEYISELDTEIDRCHKEISNLSYDEVQMRVNRAEIDVYQCRAKTLIEVKNDLQSRLDELI